MTSVVSQARWCNLACVVCLQMTKPLGVVSVLLEVDVTLGDGCDI